ncbi:hypothetical protein KAK11_00075 [Ideonella paludis]|uniref:HU family DNA-binding protein n=2 Tax=Ideonella paludis TaxID=1233411 RepID=A0ABS5DRC5_9BURK|nr:hypothetical protein [Ideonella paludis]
MEIAQLARKACAACPEVTERDMINIVREIFNTMRQELVDAPEGKVKFLPLGTVHVIQREIDNKQTGERVVGRRFNLVLKD